MGGGGGGQGGEGLKQKAENPLGDAQALAVLGFPSV